MEDAFYCFIYYVSGNNILSILFDEYGSLKTHEIAELVQRRIQEKIDSILLPET